MDRRFGFGRGRRNGLCLTRKSPRKKSQSSRRCVDPSSVSSRQTPRLNPLIGAPSRDNRRPHRGVMVKPGSTAVWGQGVRRIEIPEYLRDIAAAEAELDQANRPSHGEPRWIAREQSEIDAQESKLKVTRRARRDHASVDGSSRRTPPPKQNEVLGTASPTRIELKSASPARAALVEPTPGWLPQPLQAGQAAFDLVRSRQRSALLLAPILAWS